MKAIDWSAIGAAVIGLGGALAAYLKARAAQINLNDHKSSGVHSNVPANTTPPPAA